MSYLPIPGPPLPGQPTNIRVHALNSTAVQLTWQAPAGGSVTQYLVTYSEVGDELLHSLSVDATQLNAIVSNLQPGTEYLFSVSASNAQGEGANATIILRLPASATGEGLVKCLQSYTMTVAQQTITVVLHPPPPPGSPFYEQVWFYVLCGAVGLLVVCVTVLVWVCLCCKMCCRVGSENGKIYS